MSIVVINAKDNFVTDKESTSIVLVIVDKLFLKKKSNFELRYLPKSFSDKIWLIPNTNLFLYNKIKYKITFLEIKKIKTKINIINLIFFGSFTCNKFDKKAKLL